MSAADQITVPEGTAAPVDSRTGAFWFISGKKKSGKSVYARRLFDGYPDDRLVVDPTGDVAQALTDSGVQFTRITADAVPLRFPNPTMDNAYERDPVTVVFVPDMGSDAAIDDIDRVVGLTLNHSKHSRPVMIWVDEIGVYSRVGQTPPNLRRVLHHGRHNRLSLAMAGPRPMGVDLLCLAQADYVVTFNTPNQADRDRIASNIGWPTPKFDEACQQLGLHEYLLFDTADDEGRGTLTHMPKLPPKRMSEYVPPEY